MLLSGVKYVIEFALCALAIAEPLAIAITWRALLNWRKRNANGCWIDNTPALPYSNVNVR